MGEAQCSGRCQVMLQAEAARQAAARIRLSMWVCDAAGCHDEQQSSMATCLLHLSTRNRTAAATWKAAVAITLLQHAKTK
jgi:predicted nucleic acid-binding Zn ribbon protein